MFPPSTIYFPHKRSSGEAEELYGDYTSIGASFPVRDRIMSKLGHPSTFVKLFLTSLWTYDLALVQCLSGQLPGKRGPEAITVNAHE